MVHALIYQGFVKPCAQGLSSGTGGGALANGGWGWLGRASPDKRGQYRTTGAT